MSSNCPDPDDTATPAEHWNAVSRHVVNSYREANSALLAAMGLGTPDETTGGGADPSAADPSAADPSTADPSADGEIHAVDPPVDELSFSDEDWAMERSVDAPDELEVGDYVRFSKPIEESDVSAFAQASGDTNRLHLEPAFAEASRFGGRIAHGTLVSGLISAALARLPGLTIYLSQDLEFEAPVEIGTEVTADCEIVEALGDGRYRLHTTVVDDADRTIVDGEAVVIVEALPDE
ncbi:MaoC family dehydratase [Natrarchaeobius oligotrophus]|uniref:MaoC family dehydratase n=1 Tax=Natrarchaeobius chitinivorans TaxID=1679083 RepID=A0A3N6MXB0_NATCH|nr:MaoC family dehydratase [Natrarchaeobius chitinivorans]RQG99646.1 MaoC family dehydratase [Natrarchaeobius chitinivorans]